jgi:flagellar biosynthesis GTPase FlhF
MPEPMDNQKDGNELTARIVGGIASLLREEKKPSEADKGVLISSVEKEHAEQVDKITPVNDALEMPEPMDNQKDGNELTARIVGGIASTQTDLIQSKECPKCAEVIKRRTRFCKHCNYKYTEANYVKEQDAFAKFEDGERQKERAEEEERERAEEEERKRAEEEKWERAEEEEERERAEEEEERERAEEEECERAEEEEHLLRREGGLSPGPYKNYDVQMRSDGKYVVKHLWGDVARNSRGYDHIREAHAFIDLIAP